MLHAGLMQKMIGFYRGDVHEISHFLKVHAYACLIGTLEGLDAHTQYLLEAEAIVHDIACPLCREKYGHAAGSLQEQESPALLAEFLDGCGLTAEERARISFVVAHHHTYTGVDGLDWQVLLEADFLVNADEGHAEPEAIRRMEREVYRTSAGLALLRAIYLR